MQTVEILKAARDLISDPVHWTQGASVRDSNGRWSPDGADGYSWCIFGALAKVSDEPGSSTGTLSHLSIALEKLHPEFDYGIATFNDSHTHKEVLAVFDEAIQNANR